MIYPDSQEYLYIVQRDLEYGKVDKWMSVDNNSRLCKTTEYYRRVREYKKEELNNISKWLGILKKYTNYYKTKV